jgi:hypothetical protein
VVFAKRLQGEHPFDPDRLSLTSYLFMLTEGVLLNRINRKNRRSKGFAVLTAAQQDRVASIDEGSLCRGAPEHVLEALGRPSARIHIHAQAAWDRIRT